MSCYRTCSATPTSIERRLDWNILLLLILTVVTPLLASQDWLFDAPGSIDAWHFKKGEISFAISVLDQANGQHLTGPDFSGLGDPGSDRRFLASTIIKTNVLCNRVWRSSPDLVVSLARRFAFTSHATDTRSPG